MSTDRKRAAPRSKKPRLWMGLRRRETPDAMVAAGMVLILTGAVVVVVADRMGGEMLSEGGGGARDSGIAFFMMFAGALGVGWGLVLLLGAYKRWRKDRTKPSPRTPDGEQRESPSPDRELTWRPSTDRTAGMKIPVPRSQGFGGGAGGAGTRPAPRVWTPGSGHRSGDDGPVPQRFRLLRLKRGTRSRLAPGPPLLIVLLLIMGAALYLLVLFK